ncbi:MAG TPA: MerR family transcriptional regulator [Desulfobulbaceae bacterium]|nr:MerR family transcriptional regulator [Desulfobulbaceae bacterium]
MSTDLIYLSGAILDEELECSLPDICRLCNVSLDMVQEMIAEGLLCPRGRHPMEWRFTAVELRRILITLRLQRDLRVNLPGCALVLDLLEELAELRQRQGR